MSIKFSIVTPTYNSEKYIEDCICSIINQRYKNYEHIIIDGGSSDDTIRIIKKYEKQYPVKWISESDEGMYDAINKGFRLATGDVFSWLNSDDIYMPWTLQAVAHVLEKDSIKWCGGWNSYLTEDGCLYFQSKKSPHRATPTSWIRRGWCDNRITGFLQQESMFWKRELWIQSGGLNKGYKLAGDFHLWVKFAQHAELYTINTVLAGFRKHDGQLSQNLDAYYEEIGMDSIYRDVAKRIKIGYIYQLLFNPAKSTVVSPTDDCWT